MKRFYSILALLLLLSLLCACTKPVSDTDAASEPAVSEPQTPEQSGIIAENAVVATVNGTEISYGEFAAQMANIEAMYSAMSASLSADEINRKLTEQARSVLETLIMQVVLEQQAEKQSITLTGAQQAEVDGAWELVKSRFAETVSANYPTFSGDDLDAMVLLALESSGLTEEMVRESARTSALIADLRARSDAEVPEASEVEVRELYDTLLSQQQTEFADNASAFEAAMLGSTVVVYIPEEYRVLHEWEFRYENDVIALLKQLEEIDTEESTAYEDTLAAEQSRTLEKIDSILALLAGGRNFDTLFATENPDGQLRTNYISEKTTRFSDSYYQAAMSIAKEGDAAAEPVALQYGYELLSWADTLAPGAVPFADVQSALCAQLTGQAQDEHWKSLQAVWRAEADVSVNEDLITYS